jgi:cytochrome c biogenesis protein CcdA
MAANANTLLTGTGLLFVYSIGLAVPFLALAISLQWTLPAFGRIKGFLPLIERVAGLLVIATGVVLVTNSFVRVLGWFYEHFPILAATGLGPETIGGTVPVAAAFVAGLVSCISPCVFPVLPAYLSVITGQSFEQLAGVAGQSRKRTSL